MSGWIKLHRRITESDIYSMPPLYLRVFERLLIEANHCDCEIPFKYPGEKITTKKLVRRGERHTSIRQICEWVGWFEWGVFRVPSPKTIKVILDWLEGNGMIKIYPRKSNREGTHYKVLNYSTYQAPKEEKVTVGKQSGNNEETVTTSKQECTRMIKNDKEVQIYVLTPNEEAFLNVLSKIENYPLDRSRDLELYRTMTDRYPRLDLLAAIEQWAAYKMDRPLTEKSNPRSQINTAFKKYLEWGKCLKGEENVRTFNSGRYPRQGSNQGEEEYEFIYE